MNVSFLGLGAMGYPMAGHIARVFPTLVWNRTESVSQRHAAEYGTSTASLEEAAGADVVCSCVPTSAVVDDLVSRVLDRLKPGAVWVDCTSGQPDAARGTARRLAERGVAYLDAPVSGGTPKAHSGELTVMVGGEIGDLDRARPVIETFAEKIVHVGGIGSGHAVKAVNNVMMAINLWGASEGLLALQQYGVDLETALAVINASSGRSNASENLLPGPLATGEYPLRFKLSLLHKDAGIALGVVRSSGVPAPLTALVNELLGTARGTLEPDADYIEVARALQAWRRPPPGGPELDA